MLLTNYIIIISVETNKELAKIKIERIIKLSERFEEMNEEEFERLLSILENTVKLIPTTKKDKLELLNYLEFLNTLKFKRYGFIFKGYSKKSSVIINKKDFENLVWGARSLLF